MPQNVQREDQIIGPLTLRQLIIVMVTGGTSYVMYTQLNELYYLNQLQQMLIWVPLAIGVAFAFIKIQGIGLFSFILLALEQNVFLPKRRFWQNNASGYVSMTQSTAKEKEVKAVAPEASKFSQQKVKNLAALLDGETPQAHPIN